MRRVEYAWGVQRAWRLAANRFARGAATKARAWLLVLGAVGCGNAEPRLASQDEATGPTTHGEPSSNVANGDDANETTSSQRSSDGALTARARIESAHAIADEATWRALAARPATSSVARAEVVKFLLDTQDGRRIWFVDTERWPIHYDFAVARLGVPSGARAHEEFNVREYRRPERRFEMGSLVHYLDADLWTLELVAGDNLSGERLVRLFESVRRSVFFGERLRFRPLSPQHERTLESVPGQLPLVRADEVFRGVRYQPLTNGVAYGRLRIVRGPLDLASVRPDEILVLTELPDEIPVVSAVISNELQAPLGHIAILCATRGTPNMGLRGAASDESLTRLEGWLVRLEVGPQEWNVREASLAEAEAAWAARRPAQTYMPPIDVRERRLRPLCELRLEDLPTVGAKAAQLGEVCSLEPRVRTPGGFAVPFHHYLRHLTSAAVDAELARIVADPALETDGAALDAALASVRERIRTTPVDPRLLSAVRRRMGATGRGRRFIVRSSTNAEDLPGFTGAGLYRSVVLPANATDAETADAMREVWASVWLLGAFRERAWYRIDQRRVAMALLIQPFVDNATANGVAITANPYFEGRPGYFVNAQAVGGSVTGARGDEIPEQHLIYAYTEVVESELLTPSSLVPDARLVGEAQIVRLASILRRLHCHFRERWRARGLPVDGSRALDVEYLVAGPEGDIVIVQARPFDVRYDAAQRVEGLDLCEISPGAFE